MRTPDSSSPDKLRPVFSWPETCLLTVWFGLPILGAVGYLLDEVAITTKVSLWLADQFDLPRQYTRFIRDEAVFAWTCFLSLGVLFYRLRRHPQTVARGLRMVFVVFTAGVTIGTIMERQEMVAMLAQEPQEPMPAPVLGSVLHFVALARQLADHTTCLWGLWLPAAAFVTTYILEWQVITRTAAQQVDGRRQLRLVQTLAEGGAPLHLVLFHTLACAAMPITLAVFFIGGPEPLGIEEQRHVRFAVGSVPADDQRPILPLTLDATASIRVGDSSQVIPPRNRLWAIGQFILAEKIEGPRMNVALRVAPECTQQQLISVIDELMRAGFYRIVFLD